MKGYDRIKRVNQLIKEEICDIIMRKMKDPRVGFVTVTQVKVSPDLRFAKVYVTLLGDAESKRRGMEGLRSAVRFIRGEIGRRVRLKYTPEILFEFDQSIEQSSRVAALIERLRKEGEMSG
jgi:ribosome-binding factor A